MHSLGKYHAIYRMYSSYNCGVHRNWKKHYIPTACCFAGKPELLSSALQHLNQNNLLSEKNGHHSDQVLYIGSGQKAVQRLFFKFEEHSCWMVIAGLQSRLLFGSDILIRVIAVVSASTKPHSSWSSDLWLESDDESHSDLCLSHGILGAIILLVRHKLAATTFRGHSV